MDLNYSASANVLTSLRITFDPENHLTSVPGMMQAGYDSEGLRAWKQGASPQGPTPPTYFLYDGDTAIVEEDINGNVLAWNGFGADGLQTRYPTLPEQRQNGPAQLFQPALQEPEFPDSGSGQVGRATREILEAALLSADSGGVVRLPLR